MKTIIKTLTYLFIMCIIYTNSTSQSTNWSTNWGSSNPDLSFGLAIDPNSNIYLTGRYNNESQFSTVKYNSSGTRQWNIEYPSSPQNENIGGNAISSSRLSDGSVIVSVTGFDDAPNGKPCRTICYDGYGNELWNRTYTLGNTTWNTHGYQVLTDGVGNTYVCGYTIPQGQSQSDYMLLVYPKLSKSF